MASYLIEWKHSARKELRKLPSNVIQKIMNEVEALSQNPYPHNCRKLAGSEQTWRIRIGNYRVIYTVLSSTLVIEIIRVAHRKDVYRH